MAMAIKFVGLNELSDAEISTVNRICQTSLPKVERHIKDAILVLIIKKDMKSGKKGRISLNAKFDHPTTIFKVQADDWDMAKALHKIFNKLETEIKKKTESKTRQKTVAV